MKDLFDECDGPPSARPPRIHVSAPLQAWPRLNRQCQAILDMLRRGRQTNGSLAGVTSRYGARIFDLRGWFEKTGQTHLEIRIVEQNHKTGLCVYALFDGGKEVGQQFTN